MNDEPTIRLDRWDGPWPDDDPDANFKHEVALYTRLDPLVTLTNVSRALDIPLGALCRYVLAKWSTGGSEALLALGPTTLNDMCARIEVAEEAGTDAARLEAYGVLRQQLSWLRVPLDEPEVYP